MHKALKQGRDLVGQILPAMQQYAAMSAGQMDSNKMIQQLLQVLELMVNDGWVQGKYDPKKPLIDLSTPDEGQSIHTNVELNERMGQPT